MLPDTPPTDTTAKASPKIVSVTPARASDGRRRRWAIGLSGAGLLLAAWGGWHWYAGTNAAMVYVTQRAEIGVVAPTVVASGTVNPVTTVQVGSYVSGVIQSLSCDFNTQVRAGQTCARIDARPYQSTVDQESANLASARAQLEKDRSNSAYTRLIVDRDSELLKRHIVSQETMDTAMNAWQQAQSQIALDQATIRQRLAALQAARINLGFTNIVSPVDGTVVSRNVTQGQTVAASFQTPTLFLIATDLTKMQVDTNVSESDIGHIAEGNRASFTVESFPERRFIGTVSQVRQAPQTVQNVITYDVVVSVANPEHLLKPGMTASMRIITEQHDRVLRVPDPALRYLPSDSEVRGATGRDRVASAGSKLRKERESQVWVLPDGQTGPPLRVPVSIGLDDDSYAEVVRGRLQPGDQVVISEHRAAAARTGATASGTRAPHM